LGGIGGSSQELRDLNDVWNGSKKGRGIKFYGSSSGISLLSAFSFSIVKKLTYTYHSRKLLVSLYIFSLAQSIHKQLTG